MATETQQVSEEQSESTFMVIVAAAANLGIAVARAVAGVISGSGAMLSEAAHLDPAPGPQASGDRPAASSR